MSRSLTFILELYQKTYDKAIQLYSLFDEADSDELLRVQQDLDKLSLELLEAANLDWSQCGSLGRHLNFLEYYLKRGDKDSCKSDINDVLFYDLPATLRSTIANATHGHDLDEKLREAVFPLMDGGHFDSAIRKTFVLLTDRLRRAFGVTQEIDGEDLVNLVFGKGGKIPVTFGKRGQVFHYDMVRVIRDRPRLLRNVKNRLKKIHPTHKALRALWVGWF